MNVAQFKETLNHPAPDSRWPAPLQALWYDSKENWEKAHELVQDDSGGDGAWVHAYLHRKEGDIWNADYWYRRAGRNRPDVSLGEEWEMIAGELLNKWD